MTRWEANLAALGRRREPLCAQLRQTLAAVGPAPDLGLRGRDGSVLPGLVLDGRPRSLVSSFDAVKEADRWAQDVEGGTVLVYGLGGRAALEALRARGAVRVFWVEPSVELWRSVFTFEDWSADQHDDWLPVTGDASAWQRALREAYQPLWDGAVRSLEWRGAVTGREAAWSGFREATAAALGEVTADASTQARFGERWYRNALANLRRLEPAEAQGCSGARVVVAGAGPGLEDALADAANLRWLAARGANGGKVFSTDTALPALTARGIVPDLVLCLDGQLATYHHFVAGMPPVPLVADLLSLPLLGRLGVPVVRYLSGHPFGAVVQRWFPELPVLDGSLGNVSGLALRTAQSLGAARVDAWGVDFAYRNGQAYARATYVYDGAAKKANRLEPMEARLGALCYGARGLERTTDPQGRALDTTELLRDYRRRWTRPAPPPPAARLSHGGARDRWGAFAQDWHQRLVSLPLPARGQSVSALVRTLSADRAQDWLALWPLALAVHRQGVAVADLPEAVRDRAQSFLQD